MDAGKGNWNNWENNWGSHKDGTVRADRTFGARKRGKARAKVRSKVSICSVDETQVGAVRRITARLTARRRNSLLHGEWRAVCNVNDVRCIRRKMQREDGHEDVSIQRRHYHERGVNTHNTYQASSIPETVREEDEQEEPIYRVFPWLGPFPTHD